jgi:hypothetical protein
MSAPKAARAAAKPAGRPARIRKAALSAATEPGPDGDASVTARSLAAKLDAALAQGRTDLLAPDALQALIAAACRSYSAQIEAGATFLPLGERSRVSSTDVMTTASGLLRAANLAVFELGMWQSWTGR